MRVIGCGTTRCWGLVLTIGMVIPGGLLMPRLIGQALPTPPVTTVPQTPAGSPAPAGVPPAAVPSPAAVPPKPVATVVWSETIDVPDALDLATTSSRVIALLKDEDGTSRIEARELDSGKVAWTSARTGWQAIDSDDTDVLAHRDDTLVALDAADGRERWAVTVSGRVSHATSVAGWVVITGTDETVAVARDTGQVVWRQKGPAAAARAAVAGALVTVGFADRSLVGFSLTDGRVTWKRELPAVASYLTAGPATVYVTTADGQLCAFRAPQGQFLFCFNVRVPAAHPPMVAERGVFAAFRDNALRSFDAESGALHRPVELGQRPAAGPFAAPGSVYVLLNDGTALRVTLAGRVVTRIQVPYPSAASSVRLIQAAATVDGTGFAAWTVGPNGTPRLTVARLP